MQKLLLVLLFFLKMGVADCQDNLNIDSLRQLLASTTTDARRFDLIGYIFLAYLETNSDSTVAYAQKLYQISLSSKSEELKARAYRAMGSALWRRGNHATALEFYFKSLQIVEAKDSVRFISILYHSIGNVYNSQNDRTRAIEYYMKAIRIGPPVGETVVNDVNRSRALMSLGSVYLSMGRLDSALYYAQQSYELGVKTGLKRYLSTTLHLLGGIQQEYGNKSLALEYYRVGIGTALTYNNFTSLSENLLALANLFEESKQVDSAYFYGSRAFNVARQTNNIYGIASASELLNKIFKQRQNPDSCIKYLENMLAAKDSLTNLEKIQQVENLSFNENLRQQEMVRVKNLALEERKKNLQFVAIAAFIVCFLTGFILLSRKRSAIKIVRFLGVVGLLLVFEFIALFTHPWIEKVTHHSPVWSLLLLVLLASVLVPAHHYFEKLIKEKLTIDTSRKTLDLTEEAGDHNVHEEKTL